ncbi:MAG: glycosyltransferase [Clostridia bacterium]|nr:glycosyltransferase [Clostridia bacterium]
MRTKINGQILKVRNIRKNIRYLLNETKKESKKQLESTQAVSSPFKTDKKSLKDLRVAAIMDRFTLDCFRPECSLLELTPDNWQQEIKEFQPDLLFVESAWEGKEGLWRTKISLGCDELTALTDYCHEQNIPVVFWNKEDPVHNKVFMQTAGLADFVFTTDIECISNYKTRLKHERVYHLHFGAQPKVHNPIEKFERKNKFCFAGAYYHRYQERCRVFDSFSEYFIQKQGIDIYDRNYNNGYPQFKFPEWYNPYILGNLDPSEIDIAYKGYVYGINMNSITQSETMFARRVFELMASNTVVVGNYSRGVKNYFGDLTFCTDDIKTLRSNLEKYCSDENSTDKYRLLALRKALSEHLMEDRLDYIVQKVFGLSLKPKLPDITVYSYIANQKEADRVLQMFELQSYADKKLLLIADEALSLPEGIAVMKSADFQAAFACELIDQKGYLAYFDSRDWYGKNYLFDMALATRYGSFDVIGKAEYFSGEGGKPERLYNSCAYHKVASLANRRCMVGQNMLSSIKGIELTADYIWQGAELMSVDAMNYCENWAEDSCALAEDMIICDQGVSAEKIEGIVQKTQPRENADNILTVDVETLSKIPVPKNSPFTLELQDDEILFNSKLPEEMRQYLFLEEEYDVGVDFELDGDKLWVIFGGASELPLFGFCIFYDEHDNKIGSQMFRVGTMGQATVPDGTVYMKLAYRATGPGNAVLKAAVFGKGIASSSKENCFIPRTDTLVLTTHYPSPDNLYRNMFVHKRLTQYKESGKSMDVMRFSDRSIVREFEGINVIEGEQTMLSSILNGGFINTVCVHFMTAAMWEVLKNYTESLRVIIWVHGAEIQPWWRREYNFKPEELDEAKALSDERMALWYDIFDAAKDNPNIHFVLVSNYFANEIFEDYKVQLPKERYSIIHNCIDTEQFNYVPKNAEDRKKLLSIRPYASNKYANDLTVKALLMLSKEPWFKDLEIAIYGNGIMFEEILAPLRRMKNIRIEQTFLTQQEISALHKEYGVFLTPTRMDAQGVSRDEAMSSGLVPVTNAITAIPEFVDENCGILADGEDYVGMAEGIKRLYDNPDLFLQMSENAAKRVRSQTSYEYTIEKELQLIFS